MLMAGAGGRGGGCSETTNFTNDSPQIGIGA